MACTKCTECGKTFYFTGEYLYKIRGVGKQCSYTCWNIAKKRLGKDKPRASIRREKG